jgi:hypothetical protein
MQATRSQWLQKWGLPSRVHSVAPIHSFTPPLTVKVWVGADGWGSVVRVAIRVQVGAGSHGGDERGHGERSHCEATLASVSSCANHMVYRLFLKSYSQLQRRVRLTKDS